MTDNETIKAFKLCLGAEARCTVCPYENVHHPRKRCSEVLLEDALDIINRQKAEIERLKAEHDKSFEKWKLLDERTKERYSELYEAAKEILKSEARKEFAERLKARIRKDIDEQGMFPLPYTKKAYDTVGVFIDRLLAEMESEGE